MIKTSRILVYKSRSPSLWCFVESKKKKRHIMLTNKGRNNQGKNKPI